MAANWECAIPLSAFGVANASALTNLYLSGLMVTKDTDPNHPALDKSCEAEAQGAFRLERGKNYFEYLTQRHPQGRNQRLVEVPGVGHNGEQMFTSPEGQKALFGE